MCNSGYCDSGTWTCAEKPPEFEKPPESEKPPEPSAPGAAPSAAIPEVTAGAEIEFLNLPTDISIKKGQEYRVSIVIENTSQREVILAEAVEVDDRTPFVVGINSNYLRVPLAKTTLLPGENVNNETRDILKALDMLVLTGRAGGSGEVVLRAVYFVNNRAKTAEVKIPVTVISENVNKEETASDIFNKQMVMAEKTATKDLATGEIKDAIFVEPEASEIYQATVNAWQKAQDQMEEAVGDLKDDFMGQITGAVKSDEIAFFETIKQLNEAATQKEITETALRALAPPTMAVGFDLANLVDALDKKHQQEKAFLAHFGATEFKTLPLYDEKGELIGSTKAIIKEENGKIYAIRIGDL